MNLYYKQKYTRSGMSKGIHVRYTRMRQAEDKFIYDYVDLRYASEEQIDDSVTIPIIKMFTGTALSIVSKVDKSTKKEYNNAVDLAIEYYKE